MSHIFHFAFFITSIEKARFFYGEVLNCEEGRSSESWIDFNFFGNQISMHLNEKVIESKNCGKVDGVSVPIPHFGVILPVKDFEQLSTSLKRVSVEFIVEPQVRYPGKRGEQRTMFFKDPFGNSIEIKSFTNNNEVFLKEL